MRRDSFAGAVAGPIRLTTRNGDDYDGRRVETSLEMISEAICVRFATPLAGPVHAFVVPATSKGADPS